MRTQGQYDDRLLIADLNDLLQLDCDAVSAYTVAINAIADPELRDALIGYRGDHERHVRDLRALIEGRGGAALTFPHMPTGFFKLLVQAAGIGGGDGGILLAFQTNETQVRNKYARHLQPAHGAAPHGAPGMPSDAAEVIRRNAADEERHLAWVTETLDRMGLGGATGIGAAARAFAAFHGGTADLFEAVGRAGAAAMGGPMGRSR